MFGLNPYSMVVDKDNKIYLMIGFHSPNDLSTSVVKVIQLTPNSGVATGFNAKEIL